MTARAARVLLIALLALLLAAPAWAARNVTDPDYPRALPEEGAVQVQWGDPARFTEIRHSRNRALARRGDWLVQLAHYLRERAQARLPEGERLEITIVDLARAGQYEPLPGTPADDVRVYRDLYPPLLVLDVRRLDAQGRVLEQGRRTLRDPAYLTRGAVIGSGDPLRYEKRLIDDWLARELPRPR